MFSIFKEVSQLGTEGKLHKKLIFRIVLLFLISVVLGGIMLYNIVLKGESIVIALLLAGIGFILGFYVFSRMSVVHWNEEEDLVQTGKMDMLGIGILVLYIVFEIGFKTLLNDFYPASAGMFIISVVFGTLSGRAIGTLVEIHRVFRSTHPTV